MTSCPLCAPAGETVLWRDPVARVITAPEPAYPGYCRVVLARHAAELSDLAAGERERLLRVVLDVERAVRAVLRPDKVNLASLGNLVPHLHWHVIPRWRDDPCFPDAIWAPPRRPAAARAAADWQRSIAERLRAALGAPAQESER
jgi:diadenosine tetraphosphate (Ap4A) HIT family hydrolase